MKFLVLERGLEGRLGDPAGAHEVIGRVHGVVPDAVVVAPNEVAMALADGDEGGYRGFFPLDERLVLAMVLAQRVAGEGEGLHGEE